MVSELHLVPTLKQHFHLHRLLLVLSIMEKVELTVRIAMLNVSLLPYVYLLESHKEVQKLKS